MDNIYIQPGEILDIVASANTAAGDLVKVADDFYGVAPRPIANGKTGAVVVKGVFKGTAGGAVTKGAVVYLSSGKLVATPGSGTKVGIALEAASASGDKIAYVLNAGVSGYSAG